MGEVEERSRAGMDFEILPVQQQLPERLSQFSYLGRAGRLQRLLKPADPSLKANNVA